MVPARYGFTQQDAQLPRMALAYPDWAKRARYQAVWPALCWPAGRNSLADSGRAEMPLDARSLSMTFATATGSSPLASRWLVISVGAVPSALTVDSQVCHAVGFCSGSEASVGPRVAAPGARLLSWLMAVFHMVKYWVVSKPG